MFYVLSSHHCLYSCVCVLTLVFLLTCDCSFLLVASYFLPSSSFPFLPLLFRLIKKHDACLRIWCLSPKWVSGSKQYISDKLAKWAVIYWYALECYPRLCLTELQMLSPLWFPVCIAFKGQESPSHAFFFFSSDLRLLSFYMCNLVLCQCQCSHDSIFPWPDYSIWSEVWLLLNPYCFCFSTWSSLVWIH